MSGLKRMYPSKPAPPVDPADVERTAVKEQAPIKDGLGMELDDDAVRHVRADSIDVRLAAIEKVRSIDG